MPSMVDSCGSFPDASTNKILNGQEAEAPWPWIVRIGRTFKEHGQVHYCSGTVINERFVLTAEHCFAHIKQMDPDRTGSLLSDIYMTFGDWRSDGKDILTLTPLKIFFRPDRFSPTDNTTPNAFTADMAVLEIPNLINHNKNRALIKAACLPAAPIPAGTHCWVAGWGHTSMANLNDLDAIPNVLHEAGLNTMSLKYCRDHSDVINVLGQTR